MKRSVETILINENGEEIRMSFTIRDDNKVAYSYNNGKEAHISFLTIKEALAIHKLLGKLPLPKLR